MDGDSPVERAIETELGTFVVERDSGPYKRAAARAEARKSEDFLGGVDSEALRDGALLELGKPFVPTEVVGPPMTLAEQVAEFLRGGVRLGLDAPHLEWVRRLEPWLRAASEGAPAALLPFAVDVR